MKCTVGNASLPIYLMVKYANLGMVAFVSPVFGGAVHDMTIFSTMLPTYELFLLKSPAEIHVEDSLPNQLSWALLADKGYVGANERIRCVVPIKSVGPLTPEQKEYNDCLSSTRVICENYYGRLKQKFKCQSDCYKGDAKFYEIFSDICIALTNYDIVQRPLRQDDYRFYSKLLKNDQLKKEEKKRIRHEKYLERKERRQNAPENPFNVPTATPSNRTRNWYRSTQ